MNVDEIIKRIEEFQADLLVRRGDGVEINDPGALSQTIVKIRLLLVQLVDKVADAELEFKRKRAAKFDEQIKAGVKKSPAKDSLAFDLELINMEATAERLKNYMKYVDSLVSSVQSLLKVQISGEKNQY